MRGSDGLSRQVISGSTARRPRGETSSSVTSLLLAPGESVGMGAGRSEARRRGRGFFKALGWEGPNSGAAPAWYPVAGWVMKLLARAALEGRTARQDDETLGSPCGSQALSPRSFLWIDSLHGSEPSAIGSSPWLLGCCADFPACGRELREGWFSWNVFTMLHET